MSEKTKLEERLEKIGEGIIREAEDRIDSMKNIPEEIKEELTRVKNSFVESLKEMRALSVLDVDNLIFAKSFGIKDIYTKLRISVCHDSIRISQDERIKAEIPVCDAAGLMIKVIITEIKP